MHNKYPQVTTRFLKDDERFLLSEEKEMPLKSYTIIHTDAKLNDEERAILIKWANGIRNVSPE